MLLRSAGTKAISTLISSARVASATSSALQGRASVVMAGEEEINTHGRVFAAFSSSTIETLSMVDDQCPFFFFSFQPPPLLSLPPPSPQPKPLRRFLSLRSSYNIFKFPTAATKGAPQGALAVSPDQYPRVRRDEAVVEELHGTRVADPYRWLEDPDSKETEEFVEKQNVLTASVLAQCKTRGKFKELMTVREGKGEGGLLFCFCFYFRFRS